MNSLRMCCACKNMKGKEELIRVVKTKEGLIFVNDGGKINGRGAYICRNNDCIEKVKKNKLLNKAFKEHINEEIYEKLLVYKEN